MFGAMLACLIFHPNALVVALLIGLRIDLHIDASKKSVKVFNLPSKRAKKRNRKIEIFVYIYRRV
jgi:uncharacterized membrane protein YraQ (UPF0718 family)